MNPLLGVTKAKILNHLLERKMTAGEISSLLDMQVSAARKHLEALRELKVVNAQFSKEGLGRPKKFYVLTEEGRELFPRRYEKVLDAVVGSLVRAKERGLVERVVKEVASDLVSELSLVGDTSRTHMETLAAAMNKFGFLSTLRENGRRYEITSRNCPFYRAALAHPKLFCEDLHTEMMRKATGSDVRLTECAISGGNECRHVIQKQSRAK